VRAAQPHRQRIDLVTLRLITDGPGGPSAASREKPARLDPEVYEQLFDHAGCLLAILDSQARFVAVNGACERVLGCQPQELIGQSLLDNLHPHDPSSAVRGAAGTPGWQQGFVELLARHRHHDGSWRWLLWSGSSHGERWYAAAKDVTEWIRLENRVGRDPLTGLPNREVFIDELEHALERHARARQHLGVLFIDLDCFKQINDSIGHDAGDRLLSEAAVRLRAAVRAGDIVARLGGDEFAILLELLETDHEAVTIAHRVIEAFEVPFELPTGEFQVTASVGLATAHDAQRGADRVVHEADIAMYRAKAAGRDRFAIFDATLRSEVDRRLTVERALRGALADAQFEVCYQPVVTIQDGSIAFFEALVRWTHPEWGVISPAEFIPLAEENGLIVPLGAWILETALAQLAEWRAGGANIEMSVNLSARQVADDGLVAMVSRLIAESGVPARALCLEITETAVLAEPIRAATRLGELRALGVRIAFDDFGTGYSSLRHLSQLPVDVIKLDRTFVSALSRHDARRSRAVLVAVTTAAQELGITVVAEGVEDVDQLAEVNRAGCQYAQGFLFCGARSATQVSLDGYPDVIASAGIEPSAPTPTVAPIDARRS
jgi:diguanylate cyclase (GGDEF)-like protein/PAS domain S-box-containing protein